MVVDLDRWRAQLMKGTADMALLGTIEALGRGYGLELLDALRERQFPIADGTIYPALLRLERAGMIASAWQTDGQHPRKYYSLTKQGAQVLAAMKADWRAFAAKIDRVLGEPE